MIISRVFKKTDLGIQDETALEPLPNRLSMESDTETIQKAQELINLFAGIPLDNIKHALSTEAGQLALSVFESGIRKDKLHELVPIKMLCDELNEQLSGIESQKEYVPRHALIRELEDVLKAKTITPYRRQRINRALKRECLNCLGTGKKGKVISDTGRSYLPESPRKIKVGVSQDSVDCPTCNGTGIKPRVKDEETKTIADASFLDDSVSSDDDIPPGGIPIR